MSSYVTAFVLMLAACFGGQWFALHMSDGRTVKSESNYFSSLARIQSGVKASPNIMLLGSSMTGRMADRAGAVPGLVNLGCDGGSAVVTLRAMDRGDLPVAPVLVVEGNTLSYELEGRGREIAQAIGSDWFEIGTRVSGFSATARPTAFGYSWLISRRESGGVITSADGLPISSLPARLLDSEGMLADSAANELVDELCGIFQRLEKQGCRILLVNLPPGVEAGTVQSELPRALAYRSGVLWWDLNEGLPPGCVEFTDGLHLDAPGAAKVLKSLVRGAESIQN